MKKWFHWSCVAHVCFLQTSTCVTSLPAIYRDVFQSGQMYGSTDITIPVTYTYMKHSLAASFKTHSNTFYECISDDSYFTANIEDQCHSDCCCPCYLTFDIRENYHKSTNKRGAKQQHFSSKCQIAICVSSWPIRQCVSVLHGPCLLTIFHIN